MLATALTKTINTVFSRYFVGMLLLSLCVTAIAYAIFFFGAAWLLGITSIFPTDWLNDGLVWLLGAGAGVLAWFLFPVLLPLITNVFQEQIAGRIEKYEYPNVTAEALPFMPELWHALRFAGILLGLNLLCLPFYLFPLLFPFIYYPMNAYLLGREFFELSAARHLGRKEAATLRRKNRMRVWLSGGIILLLANIPFTLLFTPFIGIALMVHLFHALSPGGQTRIEHQP